MIFKILKSVLGTQQPSPPQKPLHPALEYLEQEAIVTATIYGPYKSGQIFYRGTYYSARCIVEITLEPDQICYVIGERGSVLLVQPAPP